MQVGQVVEYEYRLISDILSTMGDKTVFFKDNSGII
jgi:hypothetical protein